MYRILKVYRSRFLLFFCSLFFFSGLLKAQILNDSTRNVYGPNTTLYLNEENVKYNKEEYYQIDTTISDFHYFTFTDRFRRMYQDLGNPGTPATPVFYRAPDAIGRTSGFNAFDLYYVTPDQIKYYDTKSPYTKLYFVVGGNGRSVVDVDYSRNIKPNWNVGGSFQRIYGDKQIGPSQRGDPNAESTLYHFFTRYFTKDNTYQILANFSRAGSMVDESGGIKPAETADLYEYRNAPIWLTSATSRDLRTNVHIYQQYKLSELLQIYHSFDNPRQKVSFTDNAVTGADGEFFKTFSGTSKIDTEVTQTTSDLSEFSFWKNELGIKGDVNSLFYNFYIKRRDLWYSNKNLPGQYEKENYAGFNLRNDFKNEMHITAFGEYLLGGNHKFGGGFNFKYLEATIKRARYEPAFIHERYASRHYRWERDFVPTVSDNFYGAANLELSFLKLKPYLNFHRVNNPIVFGRDTITTQFQGAARIFSPGVELNLRVFKNVFFDNNFIFTDVSGDAADAMRIPKLFLNSRLYYAGFLFNNKLELQAGLDMHFRSKYDAYGYSPVIQQFILQDEFSIPQYLLADLFVNIKIKRGRVFLKYTNLTETLGMMQGYFTTPYYTGQKGTFDFGISFLFFD